MQDGDQAFAWICFAGSGTVGQVAAYLRRDYVLIELKKEYIKMAEQRIATAETGVPAKELKAGQLPLFEKGWKMEKKDRNWYGYYQQEKSKNTKLQAENKKLKAENKKLKQDVKMAYGAFTK